MKRTRVVHTADQSYAVACPCERQPTVRDWATAIGVIFSTAVKYPDAGPRWGARLLVAYLLAIPTLPALGLCGLLP